MVDNQIPKPSKGPLIPLNNQNDVNMIAVPKRVLKVGNLNLFHHLLGQGRKLATEIMDLWI